MHHPFSTSQAIGHTDVSDAHQPQVTTTPLTPTLLPSPPVIKPPIGSTMAIGEEGGHFPDFTY